jgi:hypothetical protein
VDDCLTEGTIICKRVISVVIIKIVGAVLEDNGGDGSEL